MNKPKELRDYEDIVEVVQSYLKGKYNISAFEYEIAPNQLKALISLEKFGIEAKIKQLKEDLNTLDNV